MALGCCEGKIGQDFSSTKGSLKRGLVLCCETLPCRYCCQWRPLSQHVQVPLMCLIPLIPWALLSLFCFSGAVDVFFSGLLLTVADG